MSDYVEVYRVGSQAEFMRIVDLLQDQGIDAIGPETVAPDPVTMFASGFSYTFPIAVPAEKAELARTLLAELDREHGAEVQRVDSRAGWIVLLVIIAWIVSAATAALGAQAEDGTAIAVGLASLCVVTLLGIIALLRYGRRRPNADEVDDESD